jgi:PAS domain S-box-containing protein
MSIAVRIVVIAVALALPLNLVIGAIIWHLSDAASEAQRVSLLYASRSIAAAADAKLGKYMALAEALARSPALLDDNLDAFEIEARRAFAASPETLVVVSETDGHQVLNTARRPGQALPFRDAAGLAIQKRAFETRHTVISGVHFGPVSQQWVINIEIPLFKDGEPFRSLAVAVQVQSFANLLNDQHLPKDWLAAIVDDDGRFISRATEKTDDERYIGQLSSESWRNVKDQHGVFNVVSSEGDRVVAAKAHAAISGWHVGVGVKKPTMQAATWAAVRWALILGGGFSVMSLLLAAIIARSITRPIDRLRNKAAALSTGPSRGLPASGPPEVRELWHALQKSAVDRDRSEAGLRESEERLRLSNEAAGIGTFTIDLEADCAYCSPELAKMLGVPRVETTKIEDVFAQVHRDDLSRVRSQYEAGLSRPSNGEMKADFRFVRSGGEVRWMSWIGRVEFREGPAGKKPSRIFGACVDITDRKRAEDHIRLLMREVNHRSKNLLALVQAIARQTSATNPADFANRFAERVQALAASQDLLVRYDWKGVNLDELARSQLAHFEDLIDSRIKITGPQFFISAPAAQAIGMVLHELATNAGKYGALAKAGGRVEIEWRLEKANDTAAEAFLMSWREVCCFSVKEPTKRGFGSFVIRDMAGLSLEAKIDLDFSPLGLCWRLECAAANVLEGGISAVRNAA